MAIDPVDWWTGESFDTEAEMEARESTLWANEELICCFSRMQPGRDIGRAADPRSPALAGCGGLRLHKLVTVYWCGRGRLQPTESDLGALVNSNNWLSVT